MRVNESSFAGVKMETITGRLDSGTTDPSPAIDCWMPDDYSSGVGLVIFPGGGYNILAAHEGEGYARFFAGAGIACFVVHYRLGSKGYRHPAMLEDGLAAISTVRSLAADPGIALDRLGVVGSSAGGHLAAHTLVAWHQYESDVSLRPDFGVLCYPVISTRAAYAHKGLLRNLAGDNPPAERVDALSCESHVTERTPPCFIWHTGEDAVVPLEHSIEFASALRACGAPFELHIYQRGAHGLGLDTPFSWTADCLRWIGETLP